MISETSVYVLGNKICSMINEMIKWQGLLWGPSVGVVKRLHTDHKPHKEDVKTLPPLVASIGGSLIERANNDL